MRNLSIVILVSVVSSGALAASPPSGELACTTETCAASEVTWSGHFEPTLTPGVQEQCAIESVLTCDHYRLQLTLPEGYWTANPGWLEVAIRWHTDSTDKDLDLFILKDGAEVGRSAGQDSEAEVAFIEASKAANGTYDVYVVPVSLEEPKDYEGRIEIEAKPPVEPLRDLLPDMVTLDPHTIRIASAEYLFDAVHNEVISCYPEETVEDGAGVPDEMGQRPRCLRFDQIAANVGTGPLELRYVPDDPAPDLRQVIHRSDGSTRERPAEERMEFHAVHGHWHYSGFGRGNLYDTAGNLVAHNNKTGFCLIEVDFPGWGAKGNGPRRYTFPGCQVPNDGDEVVQGIGPGWADVYNWFLADQYIDVTRVPDGVYRLEIVADPDDTLEESDEGNNASSIWICLQGMDAREISGPTAACGA
ncbi:MAG: lysyl oxidase family protein [Candidatus Binatia bacterium]